MFVKLGKLACVKSSKVLTSQNKARTKKETFANGGNIFSSPLCPMENGTD